MLETRGKKQTHFKCTLDPPWVDYSATTGPKFETNLKTSKLYMLDTQGKKWTPL